MNWTAFGEPEFFIPGCIQIEERCPLSRNITEWYREEKGAGEGRLCVLVSPLPVKPLPQLKMRSYLHCVLMTTNHISMSRKE